MENIYTRRCIVLRGLFLLKIIFDYLAFNNLGKDILRLAGDWDRLGAERNQS